MYDRRALDCTDYIPLINTLTNLAYLTGSTPTIRDFITRDGGLERLVTILKHTKVNDKKNGLKWTLAFQCVVNIGVRGTEHIRKRVVQAGMVPVIVNVLESFFTVLKSVSDENERRRLLRRAEAAQQNSQPMVTDGEPSADSQPSTAPMPGTQGSGQNTPNNSSSSLLSSHSATVPSMAMSTTTTTTITTTTSVATEPVAPSTANMTTDPSPMYPNGSLYNHNAMQDTHGPSALPGAQEPRRPHPVPDNTRSISMETGEGRPQQFFYREDDILHSLQLLAYLSKYPSLRSAFHTDSGSNVFAIVEKFTHKTLHPLEIQYWAGVIMRNACRKDDSRKGIRQCAYTGCGKWETKPREFAKCRRCRKAKYCSKQCQSKAWNEGHRWWCIEKKPESMGVSSSYGTDLPPAPPPPPPPADLQDQAEAAPNLMENGGISSMAAGAGGARIIGGGDGGNSTGGHHTHRIHQTHLVQDHHQQQNAHRSLSSSIPHTPSHAPAPPPAEVISSGTSAPISAALQANAQTAGPHSPYMSQQHLLQRQRISLPQSLQAVPAAARAQHQQHHRQMAPEPYVQSQPIQQQRRPIAPQLPSQLAQLSHARHAPTFSSRPHPMLQPPQRSMTQPHASTTPVRPSSGTELTPHLGISPDSPTPEQLAQRFVEQAALYPGQHNELAQGLHAQFQQYFPAHHQAEAKRQFSFHFRELFARHQRQQELLRNASASSSLQQHARAQDRGFTSAPLPAAVGFRATHASTPGSTMEASKQGTPRRRSDLESDDEEPMVLQSASHGTSTSLSVPMLTQDLSTTMSLSSVEFSGPLPASLMDARLPTDAFQPTLSASTSFGNHTDTRADQASVRDFKVRKLMAREESANHSGSSSTNLRNPSAAQNEDEWSYSRHMAKDASMDP
ncbi:hypothetical protein EDD11_002144 [Mortierella claussenii]|nr:hypothetical protein EDD11_002144 [Mortierella claussenii]